MLYANGSYLVVSSRMAVEDWKLRSVGFVEVDVAGPDGYVDRVVLTHLETIRDDRHALVLRGCVAGDVTKQAELSVTGAQVFLSLSDTDPQYVRESRGVRRRLSQWFYEVSLSYRIAVGILGLFFIITSAFDGHLFDRLMTGLILFGWLMAVPHAIAWKWLYIDETSHRFNRKCAVYGGLAVFAAMVLLMLKHS